MEFLINFFSDYGYFAVLFVLIICGFGVPIPEDITLVSGGVISGLGYTNVHIMLVVSLFGVLLGDSTMYWLGRIYGTKILRFRPIRRFLTLERLRMVRSKFEQYGIRFLLLDFFAAIISVPIWVYLGDFGASNLDWLHEQIKKGQSIIYILIALLAIYLVWKWRKGRKKVNEKA